MAYKVYISGKITGFDQYKQVFRYTELKLINRGFTVINPVKKNLLCKLLILLTTKRLHWKIYMIFDIWQLFHCDGIYLIENWEQSKGARIEKAIADILNLETIK